VQKADDWQPSATLQALRERAELLATARRFFAQRDVLEVETPVLCANSVTDPYVASIATRNAAPCDWLRTSPEYHMKRLLAAGSGDIYQIGKAFRHGEVGPRHQPEFTMLEWYRLDAGLGDLIKECCQLIIELSAPLSAPVTGFRLLSYREAFMQHAGIDPLTATTEEICRTVSRQPETGSLEALQSQLGDDRSAWLDLLASHTVHPALTGDELWVIHSYPASQAMLARLNPNDETLAERCEIFCRGVELANGFRELTDAEEQRRRFDEDNRTRAMLSAPVIQPDQRLLAALTHGLPECAGIAVGLDRVLMTCSGQPDIGAAISFRPGH